MEKQEMIVILVGNLQDGFNIDSIIPAEELLDVINEDTNLTHDGREVDCIELSDPLALDPRAKGVSEDGTAFVVYGKGLRNGFSVYGPFEDAESAEMFAEHNRGDDEEWEIFSLAESQPETVDRFTEIMQHRIKFWLRDVENQKAPTELDEASIEHITKLIGEGYNQGELCILGDDGDTEFRGWWNIERNCAC